jgi:hypothetical protein
MNPIGATLVDAARIARRELALVWSWRKAPLYAGALLGFVTAPAILRAFSAVGPAAEDIQRVQLAALVKLFPVDVARSLVDCPPALAVALVATLFIQPLLAVVVGSELVAGEIESGGLQFSLMRASRVSVLLGKALGLWATIVLFTLAAHLIVWAFVAFGPGADPSGLLAWGPKIALVCAATALGYVAIVTLIGFATGAPPRAIAAGIIVFGTLRLARGLLQARSLSIASWLPGTFDERLLSPHGAEIARGLALVLGWSLATLLAAGAIWRRRDA